MTKDRSETGRERPDARRRLLQTMSLAPLQRRLSTPGAALLLPLLAGRPGGLLAATPSCGTRPEPTPKQTEGPYFTRNSPQRRSLLEEGVAGSLLVLSGQVRGLDCEPVAGALLDFWQADGDGTYHNQDFTLRGHQFTDGEGRYRLETVVPGLYPGRTRHLHVKVQAPRGPVLTTQLYFAGEPRNGRDPIFSPALLMSESGAPSGAQSGAQSGAARGTLQAAFDFAIRTA